MRRANGARRQRVGGPCVRAENFLTVELGKAVEARHPFADGPARLGHPGFATRCALHGVDDGAIAGAPAQYAGERVFDLPVRRRRIRPQKRYGGGKRGGRADAALRCAFDVESRAQARDDGFVVAQRFDRLETAILPLARP